MKRLVPQIVNDVNVYVDGKGYLGVVNSLKLPDISQEMVETKGIIGAKYATGAINAMEATFKLKVADINLFAAYGLNTFANKIPLVFKASIKQDNRSIPLLAAITGDFESVNVSELNSGSEVEAEVKVHAHFYSLAIDNVPMIEIDSKNMICMIGGVDYLSNTRANL